MKRSAAVVLVVASIAGAACGGGDDGELRVTSSAFGAGGLIPERFSCEGENVSPPLAWSGVPDGAVEIAVVVSDPDAPDGTFFHWLLLGLDPDEDGLDAGELPKGARQAKGSSENPTYIGMCPPPGEEHDYHFTVHALGRATPADADRSPADVVRLVTERSVAQGTLTARYRG